MEYEENNLKLFRHLHLWIVLFFVVGCVGPTSPFGAVDVLTPKEVRVSLVEKTSTKAPMGLLRPKIRFYPDRQIYHSAEEFRVEIVDPDGIPEDYKLTVQFQSYNVTKSFLRGAKVRYSENRKKLIYRWKRLNLLAKKPNEIVFSYQRHPRDRKLIASYHPPLCNMFIDEGITNTKPFKPPLSTIQYVGLWSNKFKYNAAFTAGLVAQESGFNENAVSWAKAIGLTQVTPIADRELAKTYNDWPRSNKITRFPAAVVKTLIKSGNLSSKEDWRLNPELSILGGLEYVRYLDDYWRKGDNFRLLSSLIGNSDERKTEVILASYNSGAYRVKEAMGKMGRDYLLSKNLGEARKYVRRINSYCYHFGKKPHQRGEL